MRDPPGGGLRRPPKSRHGDGAGMGRASGNSGSSSGERRGDCWGSGEFCQMDSSSVFLEGVPDGNSGDHMEMGEIISEAGCGSGGVGDDMSLAAGMHARDLVLAASSCLKSADQMVAGSSAAPHCIVAESPCLHGEGMDVEGCIHVKCRSILSSDACAVNSLNGVVKDGGMAQGKVLGSHGLHGQLSAEVCMGSGNKQGKFFSSKSTDVSTSGDCVFAQEKCKVQNSIPLGSLDFSLGDALKMKDIGKGREAKSSRFTNVHQSANVWSRPAVVALPKIINSRSFLVDENTVRLDEEALHANYKQFDGALIGRLFGKPLAYFHLYAELKRRREHFGSFHLVMTNAFRFICFFDCVEARDNAMMGGPWVIAGQVLGINSWSASFINSPKDELITPIWVRLPGLPLHCWDSQNLIRITTPIVEPLWIDSSTDSQNLIRITTPIVEPLWIDSATALLERGAFYEGMCLDGLVKAGQGGYMGSYLSR